MTWPHWLESALNLSQKLIVCTSVSKTDVLGTAMPFGIPFELAISAAPPTWPLVAVTPVTVPLLPFAVESFAVKAVPLGKCHTPLTLLSHTPIRFSWLHPSDVLM